MLKDDTARGQFTDFAATFEPRLRRALTAAFGSELGREAAAEALAYGWQHWARVGVMENPAGYLFRVGQGKARRMRSRRTAIAPVTVGSDVPWVEPGLVPALGKLSERQRVVVSLVHAFDWSMSEVAAFLGVSKATIQSYEKRAMKKLQQELGADQ